MGIYRDLKKQIATIEADVAALAWAFVLQREQEVAPQLPADTIDHLRDFVEAHVGQPVGALAIRRGLMRDAGLLATPSARIYILSPDRTLITVAVEWREATADSFIVALGEFLELLEEDGWHEDFTEPYQPAPDLVLL